ncbi:DUF4129 domain-containing protein [Demequina sp.]|uniref:DUF4129 domain-containing protein n=1 Tax=Demequina sp. TaxID=2050685 RepID=UPI003D148F36
MTWRAQQRRGTPDMRFDVPVDPDAETAREWAREELAKSEYTQGTGTNYLQRFFDWINNIIENLGNGFGGTGGGWGPVIAVVIGIALLAVIVWIVVGPLRRSRRARAVDEELGDLALTAADLLATAAAAARAGDWNTAVIEAYRSLIRSLAEREIIDAKPGMTAFEAALVTSEAVPAMARDIHEDADVFDAVRYGHLTANREHYEHVLATRDAARKARAEVPA